MKSFSITETDDGPDLEGGYIVRCIKDSKEVFAFHVPKTETMATISRVMIGWMTDEKIGM